MNKNKFFQITTLSMVVLALLMFSRAMVASNESDQTAIIQEEGCLNPELPEFYNRSQLYGQKCWCWTAYDNKWWEIGREEFCLVYTPGSNCLDVICKTWRWNDFIKCYLGENPPGLDTLVPDSTGLAH